MGDEFRERQICPQLLVSKHAFPSLCINRAQRGSVQAHTSMRRAESVLRSKARNGLSRCKTLVGAATIFCRLCTTAITGGQSSKTRSVLVCEESSNFFKSNGFGRDKKNTDVWSLPLILFAALSFWPGTNIRPESASGVVHYSIEKAQSTELEESAAVSVRSQNPSNKRGLPSSDDLITGC